MHILPEIIWVNILVIIGAFFILSYSANFLVDGAVGVAVKLKVSKIIIGIVLVGFATTAPEFTVSLLSALRGLPEIALGNALGSVIVDDALALGLGIIVSPIAIKVDSHIIKTTGLFLLLAAVASFILALNAKVSRIEGVILVVAYIIYIAAIVRGERKKYLINNDQDKDEDYELDQHRKSGNLLRQILRLALGVVGIIVASEFLVDASIFVARTIGASEAIIGLTIIAIGTSLPEIATSIAACRRRHGDLALGNIIGADILNILWIIGASAIANPIYLERRMIFYSFPWMLIVLILMLIMARTKYMLFKRNGIVLVSVYIIYLVMTVMVFYLGFGNNFMERFF